jgi:hypothetical protein
VKHDGYRIIVLKQGERVKVWARCGADFTDRFLGIVGRRGGRAHGRRAERLRRARRLEREQRQATSNATTFHGSCNSMRS